MANIPTFEVSQFALGNSVSVSPPTVQGRSFKWSARTDRLLFSSLKIFLFTKAMPPLDWPGTMGYHVPPSLMSDNLDESPYGRHHYSPTPLREFLGMRGGSFNPVRYAPPRECTPRGRGLADAGELAVRLRDRGRADDAADGLVRGRGNLDSIRKLVAALPTRNSDILRDCGHADDTADDFVRRSGDLDYIRKRMDGLSPTYPDISRGRGHVNERRVRFILPGEHDDDLPRGILKNRRRGPDLAAGPRYQPARRQPDPDHDHTCNSHRCLNTANISLGARVWLDHDSDHERHNNHNHNRHGCQHNRKCCGCCDSNSKDDKKHGFKTRDVTLRGKCYQIRKSFLAEFGKFENEFAKFVEKKSEEELPNEVIQMLVDCINDEPGELNSAINLVGLNILASNLGCRSAVEDSLQELKKIESDSLIRADELTKICGTITMSGKVDDRLQAWLKRFICKHDAWHLLQNSQKFRLLVTRHPEVKTRLETIMGWRDNEDEFGFMIM
ncbi:hypothetical protein OIDMADRAFT_178357 [Oidiodendron maius Zn]|uniref:BTB domain-containing protein n=1 Tax=Oidiodendron maius (strain Zn) TaxID=913774 RepID=A0A0C3DQJ2_OIDMZ|nr:hypothetical protein OIDMADRAFT_178357 [Oidiodendron maius Zn]